MTDEEFDALVNAIEVTPDQFVAGYLTLCDLEADPDTKEQCEALDEAFHDPVLTVAIASRVSAFCRIRASLGREHLRPVGPDGAWGFYISNACVLACCTARLVPHDETYYFDAEDFAARLEPGALPFETVH